MDHYFSKEDMTRVLPSLLSADIFRLETEVRALEQAGADALHVDVMDGHFVPNLTFGPLFVQALRPNTSLELDVHLMVKPVAPLVIPFLHAGADALTFHIEAEENPKEILQVIKSAGKKAGLSLKPNTPINTLIPFLPFVDSILVMTVEPGFGGQSFMENQLSKIAALSSLVHENNLSITLNIDGGITPVNAPRCLEAGAHALIAGTSVFTGGPSAYHRNIAALKGMSL